MPRRILLKLEMQKCKPQLEDSISREPQYKLQYTTKRISALPGRGKLETCISWRNGRARETKGDRPTPFAVRLGKLTPQNEQLLLQIPHIACAAWFSS